MAAVAREARRHRIPRLRDRDPPKASITALTDASGKPVDVLKKGATGAVILNQTPFYGESGGQVGDTGELRSEGVKFRVTETQKKAGDMFVHLGTVEAGELKVGAPLLLEVDHARRSAIRANHSATHLLHEALRQVLGDHVAQKGSLVSPERLRFDFTHQKAITEEELAQGRGHRQRGPARKRRSDDALDVD